MSHSSPMSYSLTLNGIASNEAFQKAEAHAHTIAWTALDGGESVALDYDESGEPIDSTEDFAAITIEVERVTR